MNREQKELQQSRDKFQNQIRKQKRGDALSQKRKKYQDMKKDPSEIHDMQFEEMVQDMLQDQQLRQKVYEWNKQQVIVQNIEQIQQFINQYIESVQRNDTATKIQSLIILRKLISIADNQDLIDIYIQSGVLDRMFIDIQNHQNDYIGHEYHWIFANITSGSTQDCQYLVSRNMVPILMNQIQIGQQTINENCLWSICNLVCDNDDTSTQMIIDMKGIQIMMDNLELACKRQNQHQYLKSQYLRVLKETIGIFCLICQKKHLTHTKNQNYIAPVFNLAKEILSNDIFLDGHLVQKCLTTIQSLSSLSDLGLQMVVDNDLLDKIYNIYSQNQQRKKQMDHDSLNQINLQICRIYGNLVADTEYNTNYALEKNGLNVIVEQLEQSWWSNSLQIRKSCLLSLSNISIGTKDQIEFMFVRYPNIPDILNKLFNQETDNQVIQEAMIFMMNLCNKAPEKEFIKLFYTEDTLVQMIENIEKYQDSAVISALQILNMVFEYGEKNKQSGKNMFVYKIQNSSCIYQLEDLQNNSNNEIYELIQKVIQDHLAWEEPEY